MQTVIRLVPQDFEIVSGNDKKLSFETLDQDGLRVDLTGATIVWAFSNAAKNKNRIITYTSPTQVTLTDALNGLFTVDILAADTEALPAGEYYHEARSTAGSGKKSTLAYGTIFLLDNIIDT